LREYVIKHVFETCLIFPSEFEPECAETAHCSYVLSGQRFEQELHLPVNLYHVVHYDSVILLKTFIEVFGMLS
jgi:hypothetical protein